MDYLDNNRRLSLGSIQSFQQLYFTKSSADQIENLDQRVIERWSSIDQPSMTFYRYRKKRHPFFLFFLTKSFIL